MIGFGFRVPGFGFRVPGFGVLVFGLRVLWLTGLTLLAKLMISRSGFTVDCRLSDSGCTVFLIGIKIYRLSLLFF